MPEAEGSSRRWAIGLIVTVLGIVVSGLATLMAAGRIGCPDLICRPASTPESTVDTSGGPAVTLSPDTGPAGTSVTVRLAGFAANESVTIKLRGDRIGNAQADGKGAATQLITVSSALAGSAPSVVTLTAEGDTSHRVATALFRLTPE